MRKLTLVFLSTTDWQAPQFGSRQQLAQRLARRGHRVLFVEVPRSFHSLWSDPGAVQRFLHTTGRSRPAAANLVVYTPPAILPHLYAPGALEINHRLLTSGVRRALRKLQWRPDVLWTYWPHTGSLAGRLGEQAAVYHCIDDFVAIGYPLTPRRRLARLEWEQCRTVDLVIVRSEELAARHRRANPATHVLPGGVDLAQFDPERVAPAAEFTDLLRPRVGFVGTCDDRLDCELLAHCARSLPTVSFVLVGPIKRHRISLRQLAQCPNVHFHPARPPAEVPAAIAALDVALIPYRRVAATHALTPLKLYEYLAMGRPVVATDLPYLRREEARIRLAADAGEFTTAVRHMLEAPPTLKERADWRAAAAEMSWDRQVEKVEEWLSSVLEPAP